MVISLALALVFFGGLAVLYRFLAEAAARRYSKRAIPLVLVGGSLLFGVIAVLRLQVVEPATASRAATNSPWWMGGLMAVFFLVTMLPVSARMLVAPLPASSGPFAGRAAAAVLWFVGGVILILMLGLTLELMGINFLPPLSPVVAPSGAV